MLPGCPPGRALASRRVISSRIRHGYFDSALTPATRTTGAGISASSVSTRAVFPMPGSPSIATTLAEPPVADCHAARRTATSFSRPTKTFLIGRLVEP